MLDDERVNEILAPWIAEGKTRAAEHGPDWIDSLDGAYDGVVITFIPHYRASIAMRSQPHIRGTNDVQTVHIKYLMAVAAYVLRHRGPYALL